MTLWGRFGQSRLRVLRFRSLLRGEVARAQLVRSDAEGRASTACYLHASDREGHPPQLILRENWRDDPEGRALEDADCLVFLETKLEGYLDEWEEKKTVNILKKTLRKMTPAGQEHAGLLRLSDRCVELLRQANS